MPAPAPPAPLPPILPDSCSSHGVPTAISTQLGDSCPASHPHKSSTTLDPIDQSKRDVFNHNKLLLPSSPYAYAPCTQQTTIGSDSGEPSSVYPSLLLQLLCTG
jgi:hypothetical protein